MPYLMDASGLIQAKDNYYGLDFCPGYWDWLTQANSEGRVYSIDRIQEELEAMDDPLTEWAKQRGERFFVPIDSATIHAYAQVNQWVSEQGFHPQNVLRFTKGADPFLIAFAYVYEHTVVTSEMKKPDEHAKVKIPAVCQHFKVECITPFEMLRREQVRLILQP